VTYINYSLLSVISFSIKNLVFVAMKHEHSSDQACPGVIHVSYPMPTRHWRI